MDSRIRALILSAQSSIDAGLSELSWADHPGTIQELNNSKDVLDVVLDLLGDPDDPDELNFDSY